MKEYPGLMTADELLKMKFEPMFPKLWENRDLNSPYVYFILAHDSSLQSLSIHNARYVKIGVSVDPVKREADMQTGSPDELNVWNCVRGGYKLEKKIHRFLDDYHIRGEWFKMSELVIQVMQDAPVDMPEITW